MVKKKRGKRTALDKFVSIIKEIEVLDELGEPVISETIFGETWAAIWPRSANEVMRNGQEIGTITHRIRIRYQTGIAHNMRIRHGARMFRITQQPINIDEGDEWLDFLCEEEFPNL